jgi:hypothetical protein
MALKKCPDCGKEVSSDAPACLNCGRRLRGGLLRGLGTGCLVLFVLAILVGVLSSLIGGRNTSGPNPRDAKTPVSPLVTPSERKKTLAGFKSKKDEFQKATFYEPVGSPVGGSHVSLYIVESGDSYTLRMVVMYEGSDWIFWDHLIVKSGDKVVDLDASLLEIKHDNSSDTVWETLDVPVSTGVGDDGKLNVSEACGLVFATLMQAKSASMRFAGKHVTDRSIGSNELARFQKTGKAFLALYGLKD